VELVLAVDGSGAAGRKSVAGGESCLVGGAAVRRPAGGLRILRAGWKEPRPRGGRGSAAGWMLSFPMRRAGRSVQSPGGAHLAVRASARSRDGRKPQGGSSVPGQPSAQPLLAERAKYNACRSHGNGIWLRRRASCEMARRIGDFTQYKVSGDPSLLNFEYVFGFLKNESYWGRDLTEHELRRSLKGSENFGLYDLEKGGRQIGFARAITDRVLFAYLRDAFIEESYRGLGLGAHLCRSVLGSERLKNVRHWMLATRDAHSFYERFGFGSVREPEMFMERKRSGKKGGR
jgi:GNAT superfamily N-acetyltransferase